MQNAFSTRLSRSGFNFFSMLVVDLLHEFELGVWKAVFTHLMRLLLRVLERSERLVLNGSFLVGRSFKSIHSFIFFSKADIYTLKNSKNHRKVSEHFFCFSLTFIFFSGF